MITCHLAPRLVLDFWFEKTTAVATLYCKKHSDNRPIGECERYAVLSISCEGEIKRHEGLPNGWGFHLTDKRKIKEVK